MLFWRVKPLDDILATAEKKSLTRTLGAAQLTMLGIGAIIGTGIFVLTAEAATKAGPAMMISFVIAAAVCAVAALCYAEMASMVPVSGSAYTYSYATMGELVAWIVGWALVLEYAIAASAVSVGWSGYMVRLVEEIFNVSVSPMWTNGPFDKTPGILNVPALGIALLVTALLVRGTKESARFNAVLVAVKLVALGLFIILAVPAINSANFEPFMPNGFFAKNVTDPLTGSMITVGVSAAAASIFFAYVGFDAVSTAAEETINPNRNIPIGLIGSLAICTVIYLLVAAGAIGSVGAQPDGPLAASKEALAFVLRETGHGWAGDLVAIAAGLALPSVVLMMMFGQTRIFFVMARDGLLPSVFSKLHPKYGTPHVVTMCTGAFVAVFAALFPVGKLADISNSGTLFAFFTVAVGILILRRTEPNRHRSFRTPAVWVVAPLAIVGCVFLFFQLSGYTELMFAGWAVIGLFVYALYGYRKSHVAKAIAAPAE
ncbi:amino acid permease [Sandaracinobacteroides saxicola]|uniref:Amino acid permease n=1 Tax=Sandaracinobacteroides saxicola TaxID=2759707 RepID=A0A7G5IFF2_9SPHN|nr:amino acid permease [Sandaracinobacteroides saxicola]QMW22094.1 amino acid permease [Sandaracinobacteroides saxicola]